MKTTSTPKARTTRKTTKTVTAVAPKTDRVRLALTVTMGCGIPMLSLVLSTCSGTLARCGFGSLAVVALGLMGCVLAVSLSHLAWSVQDITRSPKWAAWLLAVAFDLCLVFGEMVHVYAEGTGLGWVVTTMMGCVAVMSMVLNCWAFIKHPSE